uniref:TPM domain-containing protein n=1 Tax=Panagrolaimus sp. PS1159 TaxID=55785 RepID=A0AC35G361_9BILA
MNISSQICDPDMVFSTDDRILINNKLKTLEIKTDKNDSGDCNGKGLFAVTIIGKNFQGGNSDSLKAITNDLILKWRPNSYCKKLIIIALASDDRQVWIDGDSEVGIKCKKYSQIFQDQKSLFQSGNYVQAILNIIDSVESAATDSSNGLSTLAIIGIVLGCIFAVLFCVCCCICLCRRNACDKSSESGKHYSGGGGFSGGAVGAAGGCGGGGGGGGGGCGGGGGGF